MKDSTSFSLSPHPTREPRMWWCSIFTFLLLLFSGILQSHSQSTTHSPTPMPTTSKHYTLFERYYTNAYKDLEYVLAAKEYERTLQTYKYLAEHNYEVYGFYHTSARHGYWREVVSEQLLLLDGKRKFPEEGNIQQEVYSYGGYEWDHQSSTASTSSNSTTSPGSNPSPRPFAALLNYTTGMVINVGIIHSLQEYHNMIALVDSLNLTYRNKIIISYNYTYTRDVFSKAFYTIKNDKGEDQFMRNQTYLDEVRARKNGSSGEFPTMMLMHGFCRQFMKEQDQVEYGAHWYNQSHSAAAAAGGGGGKAGGKAGAAGGAQGPLDNDKKLFYQSNRIPPKFTPDYDYGGQHLFAALQEQQRKAQDHTATTASSSSSENKAKKAIVFYFHNKGSCCIKNKDNLREKDPVVTWREVMNAFILEFPSICLRAIGQKKASSCGPLFQDGYYSGTFWYSDCSHIAQLPVLPDPLDWGQPEFFIAQHMHPAYHVMSAFFQHCSYSPFHSFRNMYGEECPRREYLQRIWDCIMSKKLPPTMGIDSGDRPMQNKAELGKICKQIREPNHYYALVKQMNNAHEISEKLQIYGHNKNPRRLYLDMEEIIDFFLRKYSN